MGSTQSAQYDLAGQVIGMAMKVHRKLGSGFVESVYHNALKVELTNAGMPFESEKKVNVFYEGVNVGEFSADLMVNNELIIELKAVNQLAPIHEVQTVNYLSATGKDVGLLLNFGAESLEFKKKFRAYKNPTINQLTSLILLILSKPFLS
jgi:GxxExxY protein